MYRLAATHSVTLMYRLTERRTDDTIMPIADHAACSTISLKMYRAALYIGPPVFHCYSDLRGIRITIHVLAAMARMLHGKSFL